MSVEWIPRLVASAARIAAPTPAAPGILELARILSRWRRVRVSVLSALELLDWLPPHPAKARVKSSGTTCHVAREIIVTPLVKDLIGCMPGVLI